MQLDQPWTVRVGENITLSSNVSELIFFELYRRQSEFNKLGGGQNNHFRLDERLQSVDLMIMTSLHQFHFAKSAFANDLDGLIVLRAFARAEETEEVHF